VNSSEHVVENVFVLMSCTLSIHPTVPCPQLKNGPFYDYGYYRTLIGNPMLKSEPTGQCGHADNRID